MGIEASGIDRASKFATEHPGLRLKFKPRVKSPAPAGLFFTFPAASLIARLLLRAVDYTRAKISGGQAVLWSQVVGGLLRQHMISEAISSIIAKGVIAPNEARVQQMRANNSILHGDPDWFERFRASLSKAAGFDAGQWRRFFDELLAASDAIRYVHVGNPESIVVTSRDLVKQVYG